MFLCYKKLLNTCVIIYYFLSISIIKVTFSPIVINKIYVYEGATMFYTYLIRCIPTNEFYYGVRYSKKSNPNELWKTYFTSSEVVKDRIKMFGKNEFEYVVRKEFKSPKAARMWENKVLRRMRVKERPEFLNKSYGICFDEPRSTNAGKRMVLFLDTGEYKFVEPNLAFYLEQNKIAVIQGMEKPEDFGKKVSTGLKGYKKTEDHIEKIALPQRGRKYGSIENRYGVERAAEISEKISISLTDYHKNNPNHLSGKTYEEAYGHDKASELKEVRSYFFINNNPGKKMKGKTYEELYGPEKTDALKKNRSAAGKKNKKIYVVYLNNTEVFRGGRLETEQFITQEFQLPPSNILYKKELLTSRNITVQTLSMHR